MDKLVVERDLQQELRALAEAAKGMTEGNFQRTVQTKAKGIVGELAAHINSTLLNLQQLDPTVNGSRQEIPKVTKHLLDIIGSTEEATNRVLEHSEYLVEAQTKSEQHLARLTALLGQVPAERLPAGALEELRALQAVQGGVQERTMDIMAAMEFQDLTVQKVQKMRTLIGEVEHRLLELLIMFRLADVAEAGAPPPTPGEAGADPEACTQHLIDELLRSARQG